MDCVAGCAAFTGGEIRHHTTCPYYPESRTKMYDDALSRIASLEAEMERLRECIVKFIDNCLRDEKECPYCRDAAALVGGKEA